MDSSKFLLIAVSCLLCLSAKAANLEKSAVKCFSPNPKVAVDCFLKKESCSSNERNKIVSCLKEIGVEANTCSFENNYLTCKTPNASSLFPQAKNCAFELAISSVDHKYTGAALLNSNLGKRCSIDGYEINSNSDMTVRVDSAESSGKGTWKIAKPVVALNFDKVVPPDAMTNIEFYRSYELPWSTKGTNCSEQLNELLQFVSKDDDANLLEEAESVLGYKQNNIGLALRHYYGRKPQTNYTLIKFFELKKTTKICGHEIPAGTRISPKLSYNGCGSVIDGAVALNLPSSIIPADEDGAKFKGPNIQCAPDAIKHAAIDIYLRHKKEFGTPPEISKLDWQKCNCHELGAPGD